LNLGVIFSTYKGLFLNKKYFSFCLISALSYGILFTYIALAPVYIVQHFGFGLIVFGWMVLFIGGIIFLTSILIPALARRHGLAKIAMQGSMTAVMGACVMIVSNVLWGANIYTFLLPMAWITVGLGMIRPTASAGAMRQADKSISGSAASGFNFFSFVGGSICTALSGWMTETPMVFAFFACCVSLLASWIAWRNWCAHAC